MREMGLRGSHAPVTGDEGGAVPEPSGCESTQTLVEAWSNVAWSTGKMPAHRRFRNPYMA